MVYKDFVIFVVTQYACFTDVYCILSAIITSCIPHVRSGPTKLAKLTSLFGSGNLTVTHTNSQSNECESKFKTLNNTASSYSNFRPLISIWYNAATSFIIAITNSILSTISPPFGGENP